MLGNIWKAHDSSSWQNNFINGIQIHNQSPWFKPMAIHSSKTQFLLTTLKPNSYWQYQNPIPIGNIKAQFSLATLKPNSYWQHQNPILIGNTRAQFSLIISKLNSYWQHQSPILIGTTLSKRKEPKIIIAWQGKNIMVKYYVAKKDHGNHLMKKLIESYLKDYVLVL